MRGLWRRRLLAGFALLAAAAAPIVLHSALNPIAFNEFMIPLAAVRYDATDAGAYGRLIKKGYASGLNIAANRPARTPPAYRDSRALFSWVFGWIPSAATVYPTEGYYYFSFEHPSEGLVAGSLKLSELDRGYLTFNSFRMRDPEAFGGSREQRMRATHDDSLVSVKIHDIDVEKHGDYLYDVSFGGRRVRFRFTDERYFDRTPQSCRLTDDETFVTRVLDESAVRFLLLFNHATSSFYYVLDEECGTAESWEPLGSRGLVRGPRTGFVFFDDIEYGRKILVGVNFASVRRNDFFDGPGDQVPFRANLRALLHRAYPSTQVGPGISREGVLLGRDSWARFLISAYHAYADHADMIRFTAAALDGDRTDRSTLWTALTKEWWHTRAWRKRQYDRLTAEGRNIEPVYGRACRLACMSTPTTSVERKQSR